MHSGRTSGKAAASGFLLAASGYSRHVARMPVSLGLCLSFNGCWAESFSGIVRTFYTTPPSSVALPYIGLFFQPRVPAPTPDFAKGPPGYVTGRLFFDGGFPWSRLRSDCHLGRKGHFFSTRLALHDHMNIFLR